MQRNKFLILMILISSSIAFSVVFSGQTIEAAKHASHTTNFLTNLSNPTTQSLNIYPQDVDSDGDGLSDDIESRIGTGIYDQDSDDDFLLDGEEVIIYNTNPLNQDSDGDGFFDAEEIAYGSNPNNAASNKRARLTFYIVGSIILILSIIGANVFFYLSYNRLASKHGYFLKKVSTIPLERQLFKSLRQARISNLQFKKHGELADTIAKILLEHLKKTGEWYIEPKEIQEKIPETNEFALESVVFALSVLTFECIIDIDKISEKDRNEIEELSYDYFSNLTIPPRKSKHKKFQEMNENLFVSLILETDCPVVIARTLSCLYEICENQPELVEQIPNFDVDYEVCKLLKLYWNRKQQKKKAKPFHFVELMKEFHFGLYSTGYLLRKTNELLRDPKTINDLKITPEMDEFSTPEKKAVHLDSYSSKLLELFRKQEVTNLKNYGEVASKLALDSLVVTHKVISFTINELLVKQPEHFLSSKAEMPFKEFPLYSQTQK